MQITYFLMASKNISFDHVCHVQAELQIIFTVVSVFTKENFNPFNNLISPFGIGTHEIQWLFGIFLTHNWSPIYLLL